MTEQTEILLERLTGGDRYATQDILERAWTDNEPALLVIAALLVDAPNGLLRRATRHAETTQDRQLVSLARGHVDGDDDRLAALLSDHLADHPDSAVGAWIASLHARSVLVSPTA